jgi:hypothetical protein
MARIGLYNENEARAYPLIETALGLALLQNAIVDFGCLFIAGVSFNPSEHCVWLYEVDTAGSDYTFEFRTDAPGLAGVGLVFTVANNASEYHRASAEYAPSGYPLWSGYLVIGQVEAIAESLSGGTLTDSSAYTKVEPATIQTLTDRLVTSISGGNSPRTTGSAPESCTPWETTWPLSSYSSMGLDEVIQYGSALVDDVKISEGYNCQIEVRERDNQIVIGAYVGGGDGEPCSEVPLFVGEESPDEGLFLAGGPACSEVIQSVNGVSVRNLRILAGPGIAIEPGPTPYSISVIPDLKTAAGG